MRVDYFHTGNTTQELFGLDAVVIEPAPWPGLPGHTADPLQLGANCFMFTRADHFCAVCQRAITAVIDSYVRP